MTSIDLLPIRTKGRVAKHVTCTLVRPVTEHDIAFLTQERGVKPIPVKELRWRHHALARMLAAGETDVACAAELGYSQGRISVLKSDPAFRELVEHYKKQIDAEFLDQHELLAGASKTGLLLLHERMENDPDSITDKTIIDIVKTGADRTGHGPQTQSQHNVNIHVDMAERMERARERLRGPARDSGIIDVELETEDGS